MKKLLCVAFCAFTLPSFAQNGFYLAASAGAGLGNASDGRTYNTFGSVTRPGTFVYNGKVSIGYQMNNWRLQTGIQYFTSQYKLKGALFNTDYDPAGNIGPGSFMQNTYKHIGIPLQLGYVFRADKKLSIVPYLGIVAGYNFGNVEKYSVSGSPAVTNNWSKETFKDNYNSISVWGTAGVQLEYRLSNRVSIIGGPSFQYMISNFRNNPSGTVFKTTQHNYTLTVDAGIKIKL